MSAFHAEESLIIGPENVADCLARVFDHFDAMFAEAPYERSFGIAGQRFTVRSCSDAYLSQAERALASTPSTCQSGTRIAVGVAGKGGFPKLTWGSQYFVERGVEAALAKTRYRLHHFPDKSFWQVFDRQTGSGVQIMPTEHGYPDWDPGSPLRNFLQWQLAKDGGALIHAGSLAVDGRGVLLAGAGGSGKSGTVLSGILHGLQTVGDDYVFVDPASLTAYPLFDTLKQDHAGLKRLQLEDHPAIPKQVNWQNKYQFYLSDFGEAGRPDHIQLGALLLPKVSGAAKTTLTTATAKEAFLALAPSGVSQIPGDRPLLYAVAAEVSRRLPCYRLDLGPDPAEIARAIRQCIAEL
ncbi:hypothetical protein [Yoonia algicola]|uniref:Serine kinase n=1 Tax=Yoonia algicola TaxID=3137368 RepID=A0AAN0NK92_9RHOB